jgi:hypothetical protein
MIVWPWICNFCQASIVTVGCSAFLGHQAPGNGKLEDMGDGNEQDFQPLHHDDYALLQLHDNR